MLIIFVLVSRRVDWLMKGSRVLFGTILEDHVCILIDTSSSMQLSIEFVKQKLFVLIQVEKYFVQRKFPMLNGSHAVFVAFHT